MGLDMNLLYGEMIGSAIIHSVLPVIIFVLGNILFDFMTSNGYTISLILLCIAGSFLVNFGFISSLQQNSCGGIKSIKSVATGAAIAALVTGALVAIPVYVEPMRLMVTSFIGIEHNILLNPKDAENQNDLEKVSVKIHGPRDQTLPDKDPIKPSDIDTQTRWEMAVGSSFWLLFAGAYGIAVGGIMSTSCGPLDQTSGGEVP
jgi:hypothetical protein